MRRGLGWIIAVSALLALPGCGGGGGGVPKIVSVAAVADATQAEHTAQMQLKLTYDKGKDAWSTVMEGAMDFESGNEKFESHAESGAKAAAVILVVDGEVFFGMTHPPKSGPKWVQFPAPDAAAAASATAMAPSKMTFNPSGFVSELKTSASNFSENGTSRVRGDATRTYRLDLHSGSQVLNMMMIPSTTAATATMDIDRSGRLRRLVVEPATEALSTSATDGQRHFPLPARAELQLWDFGTRVDVQKPRADEVVQFNDPRADDILTPIFDSAMGDPGEPAGDFPDPASPSLSGPFAKLASGTWEDISWETWEAPTTDGRLSNARAQPTAG
jgi:hypothetical protein